MSISDCKAVDLLFPYVRSILDVKNRETPEFVGSGFLLKAQKNLYLVTAAHVMDHFDGDNYPLFLDGTNGLVGISGEESCTFTENFIKRKDDRIDISILKFGHEMQEHFKSTNILDLEKLDVAGEHDPQIGYFSAGVTVKRGNKSIDKNTKLISPEPYGFHAMESDLETYKKLNVEKSTHLALSFNIKEAHSQNGAKREAPSLNGLSGAPIWGFKRKSDTETQEVIVAILIEYHQKDIKAVLGTKVSKIIRVSDG